MLNAPLKVPCQDAYQHHPVLEYQLRNLHERLIPWHIRPERQRPHLVSVCNFFTKLFGDTYLEETSFWTERCRP